VCPLKQLVNQMLEVAAWPLLTAAVVAETLQTVASALAMLPLAFVAAADQASLTVVVAQMWHYPTSCALLTLAGTHEHLLHWLNVLQTTKGMLKTM